MDKNEIKDYLIKKLDENYDIEPSKVLLKEMPSSLNMLEMRDKLIVIGLITEEDLDHNTYVADIKVGIGGLSCAHVSLMLEGNIVYISAYAKEGIIKQNLATKALEKIAEVI